LKRRHSSSLFESLVGQVLDGVIQVSREQFSPPLWDFIGLTFFARFSF